MPCDYCGEAEAMIPYRGDMLCPACRLREVEIVRDLPRWGYGTLDEYLGPE